MDRRRGNGSQVLVGLIVGPWWGWLDLPCVLHLTLRLRVKGSGVVQGGPRVGCGGWVVWADPHGRAPQLLQFTEPLGKGQAPGLGLII